MVSIEKRQAHSEHRPIFSGAVQDRWTGSGYGMGGLDTMHGVFSSIGFMSRSGRELSRFLARLGAGPELVGYKRGWSMENEIPGLPSKS